MRTSKLVTISLLPELLEEAEKLAKAEKRTRSEFFREAIRRYIEEKKWERIYRYGRMKAQEQGLAEADVERLVDEYRAEPMNAKG
jgi:metal-responsive CopG/Arc/MetJ family transcriptional regulator